MSQRPAKHRHLEAHVADRDGAASAPQLNTVLHHGYGLRVAGAEGWHTQLTRTLQVSARYN